MPSFASQGVVPLKERDRSSMLHLLLC